AGPLVIEQDAAAAEHAVALAVVHRDEMPVDLGDAVGTARVERGRLALGSFTHLAEHLTARRLVKADALWVDQADRLEYARNANAGELPGQYRLLPARRHEAHGRQVIDLVGPDDAQHLDERELIEQVRL